MNIIQDVQAELERNQETLRSILDLYESSAEPTKSDPSIRSTVSGNYDDTEVDIEILVVYTGEPHKFDVDKGWFNIEIRAEMEDTEILTGLKREMYDLSKSIFDDREHVVHQDYPSHKVWIDYELDRQEFKRTLL